jgi:hypothetical protein
MPLRPALALLLLATAAAGQQDRATIVRTSRELEAKIRGAQAGDLVRIAPGRYYGLANPGVLSTPDRGLHGSPEAPIVFEALDPASPPLIESSLLIQSSTWVVFRNLHFRRPDGHNINIYPYEGRDSSHIVLEGLDLESVPALVNLANIKITRSDDVTIRGCKFSGWGDNAIDTIGLWGGLIENNSFVGKPGFAQRTGLQLKGYTRDLVVRNNFFLDAGERVIQIGGGTGPSFFREPPQFEAQRIEVYGNRISGGNACFSLATQSGSHVHHNTCDHPKLWIVRLLNENPALEPNQNGRFDHNLFLYDSTIQAEFVNMSNTGRVDIQSFTFEHNAYFQTDGDSPRLPNIPVEERDRIDQVDPKLIDARTPTMRIGSANPVFADTGADAVNPPPQK